jgi:hypothetical protein
MIDLAMDSINPYRIVQMGNKQWLRWYISTDTRYELSPGTWGRSNQRMFLNVSEPGFAAIRMPETIRTLALKLMELTGIDTVTITLGVRGEEFIATKLVSTEVDMDLFIALNALIGTLPPDPTEAD